jgi:hypothetical protein
MPTLDRIYVKSRDDFHRVLEGAHKETLELLDRGEWWPLQSIAMQLEAMKEWTAAGRDPTAEEVESIQLGVVVARELEPPPNAEIESYNERLYELYGYFKEWLGDDDEDDDEDDDDDDEVDQDVDAGEEDRDG